LKAGTIKNDVTLTTSWGGEGSATVSSEAAVNSQPRTSATQTTVAPLSAPSAGATASTATAAMSPASTASATTPAAAAQTNTSASTEVATATATSAGTEDAASNVMSTANTTAQANATNAQEAPAAPDTNSGPSSVQMATDSNGQPVALLAGTNAGSGSSATDTNVEFVSTMQTNAQGSNTVMPVMGSNAQMVARLETNMLGTNGQPLAAGDTNTSQVLAVIPFQDVPLTTAIETLARMAHINYILDPKIGYGQTDQNGRLKPEPRLSLRWENVTPEQALLALLENYGLEMVKDPDTGIARITIKNPAAPPPLVTRVIQLKYASVSNMTAAVASVLVDRRSRVMPDTRTSQLIVVATQPEQTAVDMLVKKLDKPTRQVLIETKIVELSSNPSTQKGIDWSGTLQAQHVSFGNNVNGGQLANLPDGSGRYSKSFSFQTNSAFGGWIQYVNYGPNTLLQSPGVLADTAHGFDPAVGFLDADGVHAVLSFLNASQEAQILSTPRIVTLDNEEAEIKVVREVPIFSTTAGTQGSPGGSTVTYSNLGTILDVTPHISANDDIWLQVTPTVSSIFGVDTKTVGGVENQADIFDVRSITTQVLIPNAHTLVMGGLVNNNPTATYNKVPLLGDIPILGLAFRSENKSVEKDNLLLFITPTIVQNSDFRPTTTTFLESRPIEMQDPMRPGSLWDNARPGHDWSNPVPGGDYDHFEGGVQSTSGGSVSEAGENSSPAQ
ncbi:MAG: hypothetical protein KGR98_07700, partial [Verrucomicrobia bacterium]|nr:hypothetical protein [Verrucomicrobiota bacterium]